MQLFRFLAIAVLFLLVACQPQQPDESQQKITEYTAILATLEATRKDIHALHQEIAALKHEVEHLKTLPVAPQYPNPPAVEPAAARIISIELDADEPYIGNADAEYALVEFSDYECPFCARYNQQTFPALKQKYIDSGKLKYISLDFPLTSIHPAAMGAAVAATCASLQGQFEPMRNQLFANMRSLSEALYYDIASDIGLDANTFKTCLIDPATVEEVRQDVQLGSRLGVTGTPSFLVGKIENNRMVDAVLLVGALPLERFEAELSTLD